MSARKQSPSWSMVALVGMTVACLPGCDPAGGGPAAPADVESRPQADIVTDVAAGAAVVIQGGFGEMGDFELMVPMAEGGIGHFSRKNDDLSANPCCQWKFRSVFAKELGLVESVALIQSNFRTPGNPGNLEVVARIGDRLYHYVRMDSTPYRWTGTGVLPVVASGNPALIQSRFGKRGNFEVVVPMYGIGIGHLTRNNDDPSPYEWSAPTVFGAELGHVDAVALIQGNYSAGGGVGDLEVVARVGNRLVHFSRDDMAPFAWRQPTFFASGVKGVPALIQGRFGYRGNFEVVAPPEAGAGLLHFYRDNDAAGLTWSGASLFGTLTTGMQQLAYTSASLVQSNFMDVTLPPASRGHLHVAASSGSRVQFWSRHDLPPFTWVDQTAK